MGSVLHRSSVFCHTHVPRLGEGRRRSAVVVLSNDESCVSKFCCEWRRCAAMMSGMTQQPVSTAAETDQSSFQLYLSDVLTASCGTVSDEMLQSTPSLGQLVDSIHSGLDVECLSIVCVGFSMKDARQLCWGAAAEVYARTLGQVPADLQRGNTRLLMGTSRSRCKRLHSRDVCRRDQRLLPLLSFWLRRGFQRRMQTRLQQ